MFFLRIFLLCLLGEGFFGNEGEIVLGNGLASQLGIVGTEHQDALSCIEEGVDVGDADTCLAEKLDDIGCATRSVVELQSEDVGNGNGNAGFLQFVAGALGLCTDDAKDSVLGRIGNGGGNELDVCVLQGLENLDEGS